jgi:hypothetical protein
MAAMVRNAKRLIARAKLFSHIARQTGQLIYTFAVTPAEASRRRAIANMTDAILLERESIQATFREWQSEQDALDAELSESLAALSAFQSHLDSWQQQLARERESLHRGTGTTGAGAAHV